MIKTNLLLVSIFALLLFSGNLYAQCTGCTVTNPPSNYLFTANSVVCFTQNTAMGNVQFQDNVKVCIAPGVTVSFSNVNSTAGNKLTFDIAGTLILEQTSTFNTNTDINILAGGTFSAGPTGNNDFSLNGSVNNITNRGIVRVSTLTFQNANSNNIIDNLKTFNINGNINTAGTTTFRNLDVITIANSYNNNANSLYINCGTITSNQGFNLAQGRVINTGTFNVPGGSIDMSGTSRFENYGSFYSAGSVNGGASSVFYNEGLAKFTTFQANGGTIKGPADTTKKGYIYVQNPINPNGAKVGPNLDFKKYSNLATLTVDANQGEAATFSNAPTYVNAAGTAGTAVANNVTFACTTCSAPMISSYGSCPNFNGNFATAQVCVNPGLVTSDPKIPTKFGITLQTKQDIWPESVPNGFMALGSRNKGFVITRVAHVSTTPAPADSVTDPREGMLVYDIQDKCVKLYNGSIWNCIIKSCNVVIP